MFALHYLLGLAPVGIGLDCSVGSVVKCTVIPAKAGILTTAGRGSRLRGNDEKGRSEAPAFNLTTPPSTAFKGRGGSRTTSADYDNTGTGSVALARAIALVTVCWGSLFMVSPALFATIAGFLPAQERRFSPNADVRLS